MTTSDVWQMFTPTGSLVEIVLRGSLMYLGLFVMLRLILNRRSQGVSTPDVLLIVLIADAAQNGMANEYRSVTEGIVLVATILFWDLALDWLAYHVPAFERMIEPGPLVLIEDGRLQRRNMRRELITTSELEEMLRRHGIEDAGEVQRAFLEDSGELSVIRRKPAS